MNGRDTSRFGLARFCSAPASRDREIRIRADQRGRSWYTSKLMENVSELRVSKRDFTVGLRGRGEGGG